MTARVQWGRHPASQRDTSPGCLSAHARHRHRTAHDGRRVLAPSSGSYHSTRHTRSRHTRCAFLRAETSRTRTGARGGRCFACTGRQSRSHPPGVKALGTHAMTLPARLAATLGACEQKRDQGPRGTPLPGSDDSAHSRSSRPVTEDEPVHRLMPPGQPTGWNAQVFAPPPPPLPIARHRAARTACRQPL